MPTNIAAPAPVVHALREWGDEVETTLEWRHKSLTSTCWGVVVATTPFLPIPGVHRLSFAFLALAAAFIGLAFRWMHEGDKAQKKAKAAEARYFALKEEYGLEW